MLFRSTTCPTCSSDRCPRIVGRPRTASPCDRTASRRYGLQQSPPAESRLPAAAGRGNDPDLCVVGETRRQAVEVVDVLAVDEDVDELPDLPPSRTLSRSSGPWISAWDSRASPTVEPSTATVSEDDPPVSAAGTLISGMCARSAPGVKTVPTLRASTARPATSNSRTPTATPGAPRARRSGRRCGCPCS